MRFPVQSLIGPLWEGYLSLPHRPHGFTVRQMNMTRLLAICYPWNDTVLMPGQAARALPPPSRLIEAVFTRRCLRKLFPAQLSMHGQRS